jgi:hypothetical protein
MGALITADALSELPAALAEIDAMLAPAMPEQIIAALTPVLAQVAATGMSEDDREEWSAATCDALRGIPGDLLYRGIRVARVSCDHPAKIVPAVMEEVRTAWARGTAPIAPTSAGWPYAGTKRLPLPSKSARQNRPAKSWPRPA